MLTFKLDWDIIFVVMYIQRIKTNQSLFKLGIKKIKKNDILIVKFNNQGINVTISNEEWKLELI